MKQERAFESIGSCREARKQALRGFWACWGPWGYCQRLSAFLYIIPTPSKPHPRPYYIYKNKLNGSGVLYKPTPRGL